MSHPSTINLAIPRHPQFLKIMNFDELTSSKMLPACLLYILVTSSIKIYLFMKLPTEISKMLKLQNRFTNIVINNLSFTTLETPSCS